MYKSLLCSFLILISLLANAQTKKIMYHPCFLMDSVDKHLVFIQQNAVKVFADTFDCRQTLLDSIAKQYTRSKNKKYLDALNTIHINAADRVENLYTDIIKRFVEDDFNDFINQLYAAKGRYLPLEKELIATMNMMIDGRLYKLKYMGLLNVQVSKAQDAKDKEKLQYLQKLKTKIEEDKY